MGITGLWQLVKRYASDSCRPLNVQELRGKTLAIDAPMLLTAALKICVTAHDPQLWHAMFVNMVLQRLRKLLAVGAQVDLVFDGKAPCLKSHTRASRRQARDRARDCASRIRAQLDSLSNDAPDDAPDAQLPDNTNLVHELEQKLLSAVRTSACLTPQLIDMIKKAVAEDLPGVRITQAYGEAEQECAYRTFTGQAWAAVTEDSDALVFGARRVVRGIVCERRSNQRDTGPIVVDLGGILQALQVDPAGFRWLATLSGSDYHPGVRGIGVVRALKLVRAHPTEKMPQCVLDATQTELSKELCMANQQFGTWTVNDHVSTHA